MRRRNNLILLIAAILISVIYLRNTKPQEDAYRRYANSPDELREIEVTTEQIVMPAGVEKAKPDDPAVTHVEDMKYIDLTPLRPGTSFMKGWCVRNENSVVVWAHKVEIDRTMGKTYGPITAPEAILIPELAPGEEATVVAVMTVQADAPEGICRVEYEGRPEVGKPDGLSCSVEIDNDAPPYVPKE